MSVRLRRLSNDFEELRQYAADQDRVSIRNTTGEPPEKYQIEYRIKGLEMKGGEVVERSSHLVEIVLPLEYPTMEPKCRMLTPVFHPNISPQVICHTDHWAAGESLVDVVVRIGEMISYQNYNIKSPRNGEAARWAEANMGRFPIDPVGLAGISPQTDGGAPRPSEETAAVPEAGSSLPEGFACANCGAKRPAASFVECAEHHVACPDCALICAGCGRPLCVLCSFSQCPSCNAVLCGECAMTHSPETDGLCVGRGGSDQKTCAPAALDRPAPDGPGRAASETSSVPSPAAPCGKCGHVSEYWNAAFCPCCGTKLQ